MAKGGQIRYQVGFDIQKQNLEQLKSSLQQLQKLKLGDLMKINKTDTDGARQIFNNIKNEAQNVEKALQEAFNPKLNTINIETFNQVLKDSGSNIQKVYDKFKQGGTLGESAFRNLSSSVLSTNIQLKETHNLLDKMATTLANTVKWNIASSAVNAISRSAQQAWGFVKALDTSLNDIRIVTGKSADEMANFAIKANDAAQSLGKSTTDYTNAALIYAQQGLSDKEVEERAKITLKAANVTGQSTSDVSEQLTAVWNGYKVTAEQAELYVDRLAAVAATTASDLEELSTGMSKVASAAAAMGVSEEQLAAQLSTIISATRQAPESVGTALRTVYARISDIKAGIDEDGITLGNYSGKMEALGFSVLDVNGNLRDMGEVIEEIGGRWQNLTREQQVNLAQIMAGQRQYNNLLALFDNFEKYNESLSVAQKAAGTLQQQQDIYMDRTTAHLQTLSATIERVYNALADTDSINSIIDILTDLSYVAGSFVESIGGGVGVLRLLGSVGLTVFSEQIAKGLNTTITNLEIGEANARAFDQALQATKQWRGIDGLEQTSDKLLENRERLLELSKLMTPEQFTTMQNTLNSIILAGGELAKLKNQVKPLQNVINLVSDTKFEDVINSPEIQEDIKTNIESIQNLGETIEETQKKFNSLDFSPKNMKSGIKSLKNNLKEIRQSLQDFSGTLDNLKISGFLKGHQAEYEKITEEYNKIIDEINKSPEKINFDKVKNDHVNFFNDLKALVNNGAKALEEPYNKLLAQFNDPEIFKKMQEYRQQIIKNTQEFLSGQQRMEKMASAENYIKMAGGIGQVAAAIQQVKNLGSIWQNSDLSIGEQILQTITNLAFSLPMLTKGLYTAGTALGLIKVQTGMAAAEGFKAAAANAAHTFSLGKLNVAAGKAGLSLNFLNTTLSFRPAVGWIAGITAAIAVLGIFLERANQANEEFIKLKQSEIEDENKKQEEIQTNRELIKSLEELDKQYKNGEITRLDLKSAVEDLIDQYGLEGAAADKLSQSYSNLIDYIKEARLQMAQEGHASADQELSFASNEVNATARGKWNDNGRLTANNRYELILGTGRMPQEIQQILEEAGGIKGSQSPFMRFNIDFNTESIVNLYDRLDKARQNMEQLRKQGKISDTQLQRSQYYQSIVKWLDQMSDSVGRYKAALKDLQKYSTDLEAINTFDPYNIQNASDFINARDEFIKAIDENTEIQTDNAAALADAYIRENYRTLYTEFNDYSTIIDKFKNKFGDNEEDINKIVKQMSELDSDHMGKLMDIVRLHPQVINSWDQLLAIVEQVMGLASSNVTIGSSLQDAAAQYNTYKSVEDAVSSGKTISAETYGQLNPEIQDFFNITVDGTYKMVGIAKDFQTAVDNIKFQKFENRIKSIDQQLQHWNNINENGSLNKFDDSIIDSVWTDELKRWLNQQRNDQGDSDSRVKELLDAATAQAYQQLDYLRTVATSGSELAEILIPGWEAALKNGLTEPLATAIADAVQENQYEDKTAALQDDKYLTGLTMASSAQSIQELKELRDIIGDQAFNQAAINLDNALDTKNLDPEELEEYSKYLQRVADNVEILDDELDNHDDAAKDVAKSIMKMNDGLEILSNNWENWSDVLTNSTEESEEYHKAMDGTREAVANLLDISEEYVRDSFIKQHLDDITDAANGSETAINELKAALLEDIVQKIVLENHIPDEGEQLKADIAALQAAIPSDLKVGTKLETKSFLDAANNLIKNSKLTVDQVNAIFDDLGFETHFKTTKKKVKQTVPKIVTYTKAEDLGEFDGRKLTRTETVSYQNGSSTFYGQMDVPAMSTNDDVPAIDFVTTKADSNFSDFSSINTGGNTGGSGGRSSGGSSKSPSPDTSKKDTKNPAKDTRDIYHDINIELKQIEREIDRVQEKQDRLYGKELLDNLNKQQELLEKHKDTLAEKQKLQEWDLQNQREILENLDVTFDAYGNISNYMDILGQKQAAVNAKTKEYNDLVSQYNALTDKDAKKQIADQMEAVNKQLKAAEDDYKNLQDKIKSYDGLREDMEDLVDQAEEETQKQIEIEIQKFNMEVEIRLDLGEAQRDWNKFRREVLEHTNLLKDTDFDKIYKDAQLSANDITSYFNIGNSGTGSIQALLNQITATQAQIESINTTETSDVYGDNKAQALEDYQNYLNELMKQLQDVEGLIDDVDKAYLDTIDDVDKNFDKQIEDYEFVGDLIDHDIDLLTLLYGDKNYDAMEKYYDTLQSNNLQQLDSLRQQRDFWKEQWDEAVARGDTQAAAEFEKNYKDTLKKLNSTIEDSAKNLQAAYENAIDKVFDKLNKNITNGMGTDYAEMEWDLMQKNADEYLDNINSAFAIQDVQRQFQDAIDNTQNIKDQQTLKKLMDEQVSILRNKEKLTEYDVQRAEKMLQVEQARIALEDARAAKTTMRLKRDSQGNYFYEYKADDDMIGDAEAQLAAAQQDLYNFDKEAYKNNLKDMLSAWKDFQSEYKNIMMDTSLSDEERVKRLQLLQDQYGEYINGKTEENSQIQTNLANSAFDAIDLLYQLDQEKYGDMVAAEQQASGNKTETITGDTETISQKITKMYEDAQKLYEGDEKAISDVTDKEKLAWLGEGGLVPEVNSGIQTMSDKIAGEGGFAPTCKEAFGDLGTATKEYEGDLNDLAAAAGLNLSSVKEGLDPIAVELSGLIESNDALLDRMGLELEAIFNLKTALEELLGIYSKVMEEANKATEAANEYLQTQQLIAAQAAAEAERLKAIKDAQKALQEQEKQAKEKAAKTNTPSDKTAGTGNTMSEYERLIEGLAGSVWSGAWSSGEERVRRMVETYGQEKGQKIYNAVQNKINEGFGYDQAEKAHSWDYYKQFDYKPKNNTTTKSNNTSTTPTSSGGTSTNTDQKKSTNMVGNTKVPRSALTPIVTSTVKSGVNTVVESKNVRMQEQTAEAHNKTEQSVVIHANFPAVTAAAEVQKAFDNIMNAAAQRANNEKGPTKGVSNNRVQMFE